MIRFNFQLNIDKPKWWNRLFTCKHEVASVEENAFSRYGVHTSYMMCLKCGRKAMDISRNCKHQVSDLGKCIYCLDRIKMHIGPCQWVNEPDTDDWWCELCGEWKDHG